MGVEIRKKEREKVILCNFTGQMYPNLETDPTEPF